MTQNRKSTTPTDMQRLAELHRQVRRITDAERSGMLTKEQREKMVRQIRQQLGFTDD